MKPIRVAVIAGFFIVSTVLVLGAYTSGVFGLSRPAALTQDLLRAALSMDSTPVQEGLATSAAFRHAATLVQADSAAVRGWATLRSWSWASTTGPITTVRFVQFRSRPGCGLVQRLYARFRGAPGHEILDSVHATCQPPSAAEP